MLFNFFFFFFFFFSGFSGSHPGRTASRSDTLNGSKDADIPKEVPFGGHIDTRKHFGGL